MTAIRPNLENTRANHPTLLSVGEIAAMFSVNRFTVYRLIWSNVLPHYRVGRSIRINPETARRIFLKQ